MKCETVSATHAGNVRTVNQDRFLIKKDTSSTKQTVLIALADGMGGLADGEKASSLAMEALNLWWEKRNPTVALEQTSESLDAIIYEIHRQIYYLSAETGQQTGSTLSLLYIQDGKYLIKQIGDSRVYCLENKRIYQLTTDQTWCNFMIRTGKLTPSEAGQHRLRHALINALGVSSELEIATEQGNLRRGSIYLLCSDGFYNEAEWDTFVFELAKMPLQRALSRAVEQILSGSASDNLTAVLCRIS